jgi:hypothetical protein
MQKLQLKTAISGYGLQYEIVYADHKLQINSCLEYAPDSSINSNYIPLEWISPFLLCL